jgi:hypothetical protein
MRFSWTLALAVAAVAGWFAGHYPGLPSDVGGPVWVFGGLALGLVRLPVGLIVTILVVPYAGAAADPARAELFRVIPLLGAAARVALDRLRPPSPDRAPAGWVQGLAVLAGALFVVTAFTPYLNDPNAASLVLAALPWLLGAPVALVAAWIVAAHLADALDSPVATAVLGSTVVACSVALAAWFGVPWMEPFLFTVDVSGRLAAFGYAPPTGMAIAFALPIAVAAARRWHLVAAGGVFALGLAVILLSGSRGPLLALGIGAFVGFAASGRLNRTTFAVGALIGTAAGAWLVTSRYPGFSVAQIVASVLASDSEDSLRVQSWWAAVDVTLAKPHPIPRRAAVGDRGQPQHAPGGVRQWRPSAWHRVRRGAPVFAPNALGKSPHPPDLPPRRSDHCVRCGPLGYSKPTELRSSHWRSCPGIGRQEPGAGHADEERSAIQAGQPDNGRVRARCPKQVMNCMSRVAVTHDPCMACGVLAVAHWNRRHIMSV